MTSQRDLRLPVGVRILCSSMLMFGVAACSSGSSSLAPVAERPAPQSHATTCGTPIVYVVSATTSSIAIYDRVGHGATPCGKITGFAIPGGIAVDSAGNLWVPDAGAQKIYEFMPGSSTPSVTLSDPNGVPNAVAFDDTSHIVYVVDYQNKVSASTLVEVYIGGSTTPTGTLSDPNARNGGFGAVDDRGNLYVTFMTQDNRAHVDEWTRGAGTPKDLAFKLVSDGSIVTTKTGALAVCDPFAYRCGVFERGKTSMTHIFGHMGRRRQGSMSPDKRPWLHPDAMAIDRDEHRAYVTSTTLTQWNFPGPVRRPNHRPLVELKVPGNAGYGVAANPPSMPGAPYH
jgi:sugar lactone lactonase YvrE